MKHAFDIIVLGAGVSGLSTCYHLYKRGYKRLALISNADISTNLSRNCGGSLTASVADHLTRYTHTYGLNAARDLWRFTEKAYAATMAHLKDKNIPIQQGLRWRVSGGRAEEIELNKMSAEMKTVGLSCRLLKSSDQPFFAFSKGLILQEDIGAAVCQSEQLLDSLKTKAMFINDVILAVHEKNSGGVQVEGRRGNYSAEMIVSCLHHSSQSLLSMPNDSMVPFADQWARFSVNWSQGNPPLPIGSFLSFQQGYVNIAIDGPTTIALSGGRQVRPFAGIGSHIAEYLEKVEEFQLASLRQLFSKSSLSVVKKLNGFALLGCRPCDDYPIIGPQFGSGRILLAGGYMGQGLSLGFYAGQLLAQLIDEGDCPELLRDLYPERLRSLPD